MTVFSLGARLHLGANSDRALSLPQSFVVAKRRQKPAPSSEGAEAAPPQAAEFALPSTEGGEGAPAPCTKISCFGKEDSNERNPSGVRFYSSRLCLAKARRARSVSLDEHVEPQLTRRAQVF